MTDTRPQGPQDDREAADRALAEGGVGGDGQMLLAGGSGGLPDEGPGDAREQGFDTVGTQDSGPAYSSDIPDSTGSGPSADPEDEAIGRNLAIGGVVDPDGDDPRAAGVPSPAPDER